VRVPPAQAAPDPVVKSILYSASRQVALIDGRIVEPGDRVGLMFVSAIERDGVILTTPAGRQLIIVGNSVGFLFALVVLVTGVVSFPMLVDRNVSAATAVRTSVRAVLENPTTMAMWGLFVAGALILGALPLFFGLAIVFPVLGHATWHLYRKVVGR